jgi:hypothetical protein
VKHTKGPWTVDIQGASSYVRECQTSPFEKGQMIAKTWGETNARLIAAAPEMLEALCSIYYMANLQLVLESKYSKPTVAIIMSQLESAIAKARGES